MHFRLSCDHRRIVHSHPYPPLPPLSCIAKSGLSNVTWAAGSELSECPSDKPNCLSRVAPDGTLGCDKTMVSAQWCGRSYKHLAEYCPKPCSGGTDAECGMDVDGVTPMKCFTMTGNKTDVCSEAGVGIKNVTDPKNLWCGSDWNNVLETCAKACPEGSDEECGPGLICYDLTGNDKICTTVGVPVKVKGDPLKRYCGATYNDMMKTVSDACPFLILSIICPTMPRVSHFVHYRTHVSSPAHSVRKPAP